MNKNNGIFGFFNENRFLSNFYESSVTYNGVTYGSSEAAYQAAKCKNMEDRQRFVGVLANVAKKLGRTIEIRDDWDDVKFNIMYEIVWLKFDQNDKLEKMLLDTGNRYLEETNYWGDTYWGVCKGIGENNLGKILMEIRDTIK